MNGVSFGGVHSWQDVHLVLSSVDIPPAVPKLNFVDIPGRDGTVDLSEATGEVRFEDRECEFTFTVHPDDDYEVKKRELSNLLNGRRYKIIVDKDPGYYWEGRCTINEYASDHGLHKIVVGAVVNPYKLKLIETVVSVSAGTKVPYTLNNSRRTVVPTVTTTAETTIEFDGTQLHFGAGTHRNMAFILHEGENKIIVTSAETVTITYQEGDL